MAFSLFASCLWRFLGWGTGRLCRQATEGSRCGSLAKPTAPPFALSGHCHISTSASEQWQVQANTCQASFEVATFSGASGRQSRMRVWRGAAIVSFNNMLGSALTNPDLGPKATPRSSRIKPAAHPAPRRHSLPLLPQSLRS